MLVLKTLSLGPLHGYGIAQHIQRLSGETLRVEEGSLYPALQRLALKGWVRSQWKLTPTKRRARYYTLTAAGRKQLGIEASAFERLVAAIGRVMQADAAG
jgi:transcriptional regulator